MSTKAYISKMTHHEKEAKLKEKNFPGFAKYRKQLRDALDDFSAREWAKRKKKKTVKRLKAAANAVKGAVNISKPRK